MRPTRRLFLGTLVLGCLLAAGSGIGIAATVTCQDGTTVKSGRGACRHHGGGVAKAAGTAGSAATDPTGATALCKDGRHSHAKQHRGACSHHGGIAHWLR